MRRATWRRLVDALAALVATSVAVAQGSVAEPDERDASAVARGPTAEPLSCGAPARVAPVQPATYVSPSGAYALRVDPTRRDGLGDADWEMRRGDRALWRARFPYRLSSAVVADDGRAVACARTPRPGVPGEHVFVSLDARGNVRTIVRFAARHDGFHDAYDELLELAWNSTSDVVFTRFATADTSRQVQLFAAADGRCLLARGDWPRTLETWSDESLGTSGLPGTRLFVHRRCSTDPARHVALSTYLLDESMQVVWGATAHDVLLPRAYDPHALAARVTGDARFELPLPSADLDRPELGTLVPCSARPDASAWRGWSVDTGAAKPWAEMQPPEFDARRRAAASIELEALGDVVLGDPAARAAAPIHHVVAWQVPSSGRPEFIRTVGSARAFTSVRLAADGSAEFERRVPALPTDSGAVTWFPLRAGSWLVACVKTPEKGPQAWCYDADANTLRALEYSGPAILGAVRGPDGGTYVLGEDPTNRWLPQFVRRCDARGRELWTQRRQEIGTAGADMSRPCMPSGLAPSRGGGVYVVEANRARIWHTAPDGATSLVRERASWNAVDDGGALALCADERGDLFVPEHAGVPCAPQRFSLVANLFGRARVSSGVTFDGPIRYEAGGPLWGYQRGAFRRFAADGELLETVEFARSAPRVDEPASAWAQHDRVFVRDARTDCVHEFDAAGRAAPELVVEPFPAAHPDPVAAYRCEPFALGPDRRVVFRVERGGVFSVRRDGRALAERGHGPIIGWSETGVPRWRVHDEELELLGDDGAVRALVERGADRRFFDWRGAVATSTSGAALLVEESGAQHAADTAHVVGADGTVLRSAPLPRGLYGRRSTSATLEGDWAALFGGDERVWLYRVSQDAWYAFEPPTTGDTSAWSFDFSSDGRELWGVELDAMTLHRYRLPD